MDAFRLNLPTPSEIVNLLYDQHKLVNGDDLSYYFKTQLHNEKDRMLVHSQNLVRSGFPGLKIEDEEVKGMSVRFKFCSHPFLCHSSLESSHICRILHFLAFFVLLKSCRMRSSETCFQIVLYFLLKMYDKLFAKSH